MAEETEDERLRKRHLRNQVSDFGASIPLLMSSDTREDQQPDNTFRAALNAVIEDRNQIGTIQNEESNEVCFEIPSDEVHEEQVLGHVIYTNCCTKEKAVEFYYTESTVSSLVDNMNASCEGYVSSDNKWIIDGVDGNFTKNQLKEWLVSNQGTHRISPSNCVSTDIVIEAKGCCSSQTILATAPFGFTESLAESLIICSAGEDFILPVTGDKMKVSIIDSEGNMGDWTYYDSFPVVINENAFVEVFCQNVDYNEYMSNIVANVSPTAGLGFISIEEIWNAVDNIPAYRCTDVDETGSEYKVEFMYSGLHTYLKEYGVETISISVNGKRLTRIDAPDNSRSQYWYAEDNGDIVTDFVLEGNNIYNFEFISDKSSVKRIINIELRSVVNVYDEDGNEIGYIEPTEFVSLMSDQEFIVGGETQPSFVGSNDIIAYHVKDQNGNDVIVDTDDYPVDFRYNNIITVIIDENN